MRACCIHAAENKSSTYMPLVSVEALGERGPFVEETYRKSICFSIVIAVTTLGFRPVDRPWSSMFEDISAVVNSVSAAVPAPQQRIDSVI